MKPATRAVIFLILSALYFLAAGIFAWKVYLK